MSINLDGAEAKAIQLAAIEPPKIDELPQELLNRIFSNLSKEALQVNTVVNRTMSNSVKIAANFIEPAAIKNFIAAIIQELDAEIFENQIKMLLEISRNLTCQNFENLLLLKVYILSVKAQLINVIRTLDRDTLTNLRDEVQLPHFFEDIFVLAEKGDMRNALLDVCLALIKAGDIEQAIAYAASIPDEDDKWHVYKDISRALIKAGDIKQAIAVAKSIPIQRKKYRALCDISRALIKAGNIQEAIAIAKLIPREFLRMEGTLNVILADREDAPVDIGF